MHYFFKLSEKYCRSVIIDIIVSTISVEEGLFKTKSKELTGKPVSECIKQHSGKNLDAVVKITFKRRASKDKQKQEEMHVRLVARYNDEEEKKLLKQ